MILCDTGPMVALVDRNDQSHAKCAAAVRLLPAQPLTTTWPCVTEAMYLLHRSSGYRAQENLWALLDRGVFGLHLPGNGEADRMRLLMRQYHDAPMDFADASLIAAAETLRADRIFTLDRHFRTYRTAAGHLEVVP